MDVCELNSLLGPVQSAAREAGRAIRAVSRESLGLEIKADGSPVTRADRASHEILAEALSRLAGSWPVISEEGDPRGVGARPLERFWLVDPLDGTKEFAKGDGDYTVNIALVEGGVPVLGVIYVPAQDAMYYGCRAGGAWKAAGAESPRRLDGTGTADPITAVVSRSHPSPETNAFLARLAVKRVVARGSSLKICAVAEGSADVYPRLAPTWLWDSAAGAAIAREAGCRVVGREGEDLTYDPARGLKHPHFIVYNPTTCPLESACAPDSATGMARRTIQHPEATE